jgi:tRNA-dihydrouridine synthase 2
MDRNGDLPPTILRIDPKVEGNKLIYQIGTGESNLALPAALMIQNDVDGLDINMGCPKKFSVSGGMGAALLEDLPRACDIISTLRRNISIPVSCKIRLLKDDRSTVDFVTALVKAGANAVAIHGREPGDESQKSAKMDRLVNVVKLLKTSSSLVEGVPIIINGDLYTRNEMVNRKKETGADAVMLARPALYNTSIFIKPPRVTTASSTCGEEEAVETRYGFDSELLLSKTRVVQDYLGYALKYHGHVKNIKYVVCEMMTNRRTPTSLTHCMPMHFDGGQTISHVCACKSMESLCKLWDVSMSVSSLSSSSSSSSSQVHNGGGGADLHRYDDEYFLNPKGFLNQQMQLAVPVPVPVHENNQDIPDVDCCHVHGKDEQDDPPRLFKKSKMDETS